MSEYVRKNEKREEFSLGMASMGFLMASATLIGIWFLPVMFIMVTKIVS
jgi:hypothetical protein